MVYIELPITVDGFRCTASADWSRLKRSKSERDFQFKIPPPLNHHTMCHSTQADMLAANFSKIDSGEYTWHHHSICVMPSSHSNASSSLVAR